MDGLGGGAPRGSTGPPLATPTGATTFTRDGAHLVTTWPNNQALNVLDLDPAYPLIVPSLAKTGVEAAPAVWFAGIAVLVGAMVLLRRRLRQT